MSEGLNIHSIREIYKYGWLRILPSEEKKLAALPKKVWVVFCIHDEKVPQLEVYGDKKIAIMHKPESYYVFTDVLHISPTICPLEGEYEFVVTFSSGAVRLIAPSWNQMMGWIEGISSKLRELKILPPKENEYCMHLPDVKPPLLPTRDPNSPLPMPPAVTYIPPGVEPVSQNNQSGSPSSEENGPSIGTSLTSRLMLTPEQMTRQTVVVDVQADNEVLSNYSGQVGSRTVIEVPAEYLPFDMFDLNAITEVLRQIDGSSGTGNSNEQNSDENATTDQPSSNTNNNNDDDDNGSSSSINNHNNNDNSNNNNSNSRREEANSTDRSRPDVIPDSPLTSELEPLVENGAPLHSNLYEHVFLPRNSQLLPMSESHGSPNPSQLPRMGRGRGFSRGRRRGSGEGVTNHITVGADRIRTSNITSAHRLHPIPHFFARPTNNGDVTSGSSTPPTFREQQVKQLRKEMGHAAGVRIQLRRRDCLGSIAFVDAFKAVWIAGWKQKEHPMLYNMFHIGDRILSIGGKVVVTARDAQNIIRSWPSLYVDFVVSRVPCGRVYALRRECEGQSLGIVQEGNTAEIKDVVPNSIAALQGLSARTPTVDGASLTSWVLTEINARPLNLFFKDNEIRDRLNAVGLDISLLVQPSDLIKQLKKQLKTIKNYKDYLLQ